MLNINDTPIPKDKEAAYKRAENYLKEKGYNEI